MVAPLAPSPSLSGEQLRVCLAGVALTVPRAGSFPQVKKVSVQVVCSSYILTIVNMRTQSKREMGVEMWIVADGKCWRRVSFLRCTAAVRGNR